MTAERTNKPFPWRCPECLSYEVYPAEIAYESNVKHDGRLHAISVPHLPVVKCRHCAAINFTNESDEQIANALRSKLGLLQPAQIRGARTALQLTQVALANCLGMAPETISRWESGTLIQSRAMNKLLCDFFGFPEVGGVLVPESLPYGPDVEAYIATAVETLAYSASLVGDMYFPVGGISEPVPIQSTACDFGERLAA